MERQEDFVEVRLLPSGSHVSIMLKMEKDGEEVVVRTDKRISDEHSLEFYKRAVQQMEAHTLAELWKVLPKYKGLNGHTATARRQVQR